MQIISMMIRFKETTITLNYALFVHKKQSNTWIQMAINVKTSNLKQSLSLITWRIDLTPNTRPT